MSLSDPPPSAVPVPSDDEPLIDPPAATDAPAGNRQRVVVLVVAVLIAGLTGTCAFYSLKGFIAEPNVAELFPVVLCGTIMLLSLGAAWGMARDLMGGR